MSESPNTEYTPATTQVRYAYVTFSRNAFVASTAEHEAEFDRWLAAHDREVAAKAEEWGHDLEAVLAATYTILKPLGEGTHAPDSPILKALAVLGEQDFSGRRLERDREVAAKEKVRCANCALDVGDDFSEMREGAYVAAARIMGEQDDPWDWPTPALVAYIREQDE